MPPFWFILLQRRIHLPQVFSNLFDVFAVAAEFVKVEQLNIIHLVNAILHLTEIDACLHSRVFNFVKPLICRVANFLGTLHIVNGFTYFTRILQIDFLPMACIIDQ